MDVTSVTPRLTRMVALGLGTAAGLVFALPVKTGSVACPPAGEGRTYCMLQHVYAPAAIKLAAAILVAWLLVDFLVHRLPAMVSRLRSGERPVRRSSGDRGREAVLSDPVLAAANWGIVPERRKASWQAVKPTPNPAAAAALAAVPSFVVPAVAPVVAAVPEPEPVIPEPEPVPVVPEPVPAGPIRALTAAERANRPAAQRVRVLGDDESRSRRLRRGNDPALVVSCWSDAASARELPDEIASLVTA